MSSTNSKRLAIGLYGMSYRPAYKNWRDSLALQTIDYRASLDNYRTKLIEPFKQAGYDVDVFFSTDKHELFESVRNDYNPKACLAFGDTSRDSHHCRNVTVQNTLQLIDTEQSVSGLYDLVVFTRFDLHWKYNPVDFNFDETKFNLPMICDGEQIIDDNIMIFPGRMVSPFLNLTRAHMKRLFHTMYDEVVRTFGDVAFLHPGMNDTRNNPLFSFVRSASTLTSIPDLPPRSNNRIAIALFGDHNCTLDATVLQSISAPSAYDLFYSFNTMAESSNTAVHSFAIAKGKVQQLMSLFTLVDAAQEFQCYTYDAVIFCSTDIEVLIPIRQWNISKNFITVPCASKTQCDTNIIVMSGNLLKSLVTHMYASTSKTFESIIFGPPTADSVFYTRIFKSILEDDDSSKSNSIYRHRVIPSID